MPSRTLYQALLVVLILGSLTGSLWLGLQSRRRNLLPAHADAHYCHRRRYPDTRGPAS